MTDSFSSATGKFYTNYRFDYQKENVVVSTSSFEEVPSNKKPLINLTVNGILRPSEEKIHEIKMKFEGDVPQKDNLAQSYGTFVLCKDVYNARKIIKTAWDGESKTLTILIDLRKEKVRPRRPAQFSFSVQIDDSCYKKCTYWKNKLNSFKSSTIASTKKKFSGTTFTGYNCPSCGATFDTRNRECKGTCTVGCILTGFICNYFNSTQCCGKCSFKNSFTGTCVPK
jgi:hypothetical protein